jgi:hypothetical protein
MDERRLASVLVDFAWTLTSDFSIQTNLDHLVDHVVEVIPVDGATSCSLHRRHRPVTEQLPHQVLGTPRSPPRRSATP